mgnify:CR=1 FL=1
MRFEQFNALGAIEVHETLLACCQCSAWAIRVAQAMPFDSIKELKKCCALQWRVATEAEILEAFSGHPQIGDLNALRNKYQTTASAEQGQVTDADEAVLLHLSNLNQIYKDRFGFIFIVCATGKSAAEMLSLLEDRIDNPRAVELVIGAREQGAIMALRLNKIFTNN